MEHSMKTRLATALSVAGILSAGSAAALDNTQILDGGPVESSASGAILPTTPPAPTVDLTIPESELATTVPGMTVPDTTTATTAATQPDTQLTQSVEGQAPGTTQAAPPTTPSMLTAFNVGDAGVVTVDVKDGRLVLADAQPKAGWSVTEAVENPDANTVAVQFSSSTVGVQFEAAFVDGQIVPSVSSKSIGGTTGSAPAGTAAASAGQPYLDDDDHDEEYDDDHDDEHDDEYDDEHEGERDDD
jgi:hypothetical protein